MMRHCHAALPRVIARPDVRLLVAITALNTQEIKCYTEVIRRVNPGAHRSWVGGCKMIFHITTGERESTYAGVCYVVHYSTL